MKEKESGRLFDSVRANNRKEISKLYDTYRNAFIAFATKNFTVDKSTAIDIYQDSFTALYQSVKNGKLTTLTVSLKTYLFQIGKYKLLNYIRDKKDYNEVDINNIPEPILEHEQEDWNRKQEITYQAVLNMEEPCNKVLSLFYYEKKSMREIALEMNYKSEQVAKNKKNFCYKSLINNLKEKLKSEGLL